MRKFIAISVLGAALAWAQHSVAAPTSNTDFKVIKLGGVEALCGLKKSEADDEKTVADYAKENDLESVNLSRADAQKFLAVYNDDDPKTTLTAERLIVYRDEEKVNIFVINAGRLCALHPLSKKMFDGYADKAFGSGT